MSIPAAWHPDPTGRHEYRYWDGTRWTEHVADQGQAAVDPLEAAPSATATGDTSPDARPTVDTPQQASGEPSATPDEPSPADAGQPPVATTAPEDATQPLTTTGGATESTPQPDTSDAPGGPAAPAGAAAVPEQATSTPSPAAAGQQPAYAAPASNGLATAALIIGIISVLIAVIPFIGLVGVVGGIAALLLGILGRKRTKEGAPGGGMAVTGIVTGILALVIGIMSTLVPVLFFRTVNSDMGSFVDFVQCVEETGDEEACAREFGGFFEQFDRR